MVSYPGFPLVELKLTKFDSAIFQAGSLLVLIAEVRTRAFLASLVPVIVNTVLNEHQLVLDIVAFVALGDFPRSRLGEKQRGKILASWVSRKMRTIAQFSIRDPEAEGSVGTIMPEEAMARRGSTQSGRGGARSFRQSGISNVGGGGSSLRHAESITNMPVMEEPGQFAPGQDHLTVQTNPLEQQRRISSPGLSDFDRANDHTPTNENPNPYTLNTTLDYSPVEPGNLDTDSPQRYGSQLDLHQPHTSDISNFDFHPGFQTDAPGQAQPYHQQPIGVAQGQTLQERQLQSQQQSQYGQASYHQGGYYDDDDDSPIDMPQGLNGGGGGLRVANRASGESEDWGAEALRHMNLNAR
jgi:hypothetical protein